MMRGGDGLIVDLFAGGGGASRGIEMATGRDPDIAINHDAKAVAMHAANHPRTRHYRQDIREVLPRQATQGQPVTLLWASPDCTHHSRAKGGPPIRDEKIRDLAWVVEKWAREVRPRVIILENVQEFSDWGPLDSNGKIVKSQKGSTFCAFRRSLRRLGYRVEWRMLTACDYGAPTSRRRLFLVARCDGLSIAWPEPTHEDPASPAVASGKLLPWRTAGEVIDWSIPCPSIFDRKRALAENTLRRIAEGMRRYVLQAAEPFILNITHGGRVEPVTEPFRTITCAHRGEKALVAASLIQTGYGERPNQAPRALDINRPLGTIVAGGQKHALVAAFLAQHNGGSIGHGAGEPLSTITGRGTQQQLVAAHLIRHFGGSVGQSLDAPAPTIMADVEKTGLVASYLVKYKGTCRHGQPLSDPLHTVQTGQHYGHVVAFLQKYYGCGCGQDLRQPLHTITAKDRMGLVMVPIRGEDFVIADIGMRMLSPRELFLAQGFPASYLIDVEVDGKPLTKSDQVRLCGNSVSPQNARALVEANLFGSAVHRGVTCPEPLTQLHLFGG